MSEEAMKKLLRLLETFDERITEIEKEVSIGYGSDLHLIEEIRKLI